MSPTPDVDVTITPALVRALLRDQAPELAELPLARAASGWDNELWRLGEDRAVRLPRRRAASGLLLNEQRWAAHLDTLVPIAVPVPLLAGRPSAGYPYPWTVVPWLSGDVAIGLAPADRDAYAADLGRALRALHRPAPSNAPRNPVRGVPLRARRDDVQGRLGGYPSLGDGWADALAAPLWDGPDVWIHGDPHPANCLVDDGCLTALLDLGDLGAGDPASDLGVAWLHFTACGVRDFWDATAAMTRCGAGLVAGRSATPRSSRLWRQAHLCARAASMPSGCWAPTRRRDRHAEISRGRRPRARRPTARRCAGGVR